MSVAKNSRIHPTSSGRSYQRLRSPIFARSFQPRALGSAAMRSRTSRRRLAMRARSSSGTSLAAGVVEDRLDVRGDRAPQAPVGGAQGGDPRAVDRVAVAVGHLVAMGEEQRVADALLVELDDLQLRQQQLREGDGPVLYLEAIAERDLVAHAERADEDVDLAVVRRVEEEAD